ncbi:MAG: hypothetical protein EAZ95_02510 [Bacteroidetes bacterium]|nr:MAG: hypothetical protein EAZ95_02510 [Bacteroidota bacterium]
MKITFKNVGQGDSIILEWDKDGEEQIGIIDCNKHEGQNPVLEFLRAKQLKSIAFIALSHPHEDHFSGMLELLEYCEANNVIIKKFLHTMRIDQRHLLDWANINDNARKMLARLISKVDELYKNKIIILELYTEAHWSLPLPNSIEIRTIAPSKDELDAYVRKVRQYQEVDEKRCSQAANLLSTVFAITDKNNTIILTADAEIEAFDRIAERDSECFEKRLVLCQVPHHGSKKNHKISFWKNFSKKVFCPAVISAGENLKYKHPDYQVVEDFVNEDFKVYATNNVNGMQDFIDSWLTLRVSSVLDDDSEVETYNIEGDQVFEFVDGNVRYVSSL